MREVEVRKESKHDFFKQEARALATHPKLMLPFAALDGALLIDKPVGLSSNDALTKVKRIVNAKKAGHTGTLDPFATGLLPLCFGEATKLAGASGAKGSVDPAVAEQLLGKIEEISKIFWETKQA